MTTPSAEQPPRTAGARAIDPGPPTRAGGTLLKASIGCGAVVLAAASGLTGSANRVLRPVGRVVIPIGRSLMHPPLVPSSLKPDMAVRHLVIRGNHILDGAESALDVASRELVPRVTDAVLERVSVTDLVLDRIDLVRIVDAVLDRIDLTELVLQRVDLDRIIAAADLDAAADRLDVDAVASRLDVNAVAARLDPEAMADFITEAINLPEIIRTSTGSVASGAVRGARLQGTEAYGQAQRVVGRVPLLHREPEPGP